MTGPRRSVVNPDLNADKMQEKPKHDNEPQLKIAHRPHFRRTTKVYPHTILDSPQWKNSLFFGFYVLFWVLTAVLGIRILVINYFATGAVLNMNVIGILCRDLWHVAIVDLVMYLLMFPTFFMQVLVAKGYVNWQKYGWIVQHIYQTMYLGAFVLYARFHDFPWIAQIFITLHSLVQLMKMHSYAVYNGYMKHLYDIVHGSDRATEVDSETIDKIKVELDKYPKHVNLHEFFMFTLFPTVVYEVDYPRTERIRWGYALRKIAATLGVFMFMIVIAEQFMHPITIHAIQLRENASLYQRVKLYPVIILEVFPPFMFLYLLTFYIIWDAILNSIAELTRFNDREFYRDWWNSTQWAKFARDWNVPVHNFLQRHVYTSSRLFLRLSKNQAMFFTFFFSSLVHELAMWVIFGRFRGYLLLMQLTQLPMQFISETKFFKDRPTLGLVLFWMGIALGPSILCSLYLTF